MQKQFIGTIGSILLSFFFTKSRFHQQENVHILYRYMMFIFKNLEFILASAQIHLELTQEIVKKVVHFPYSLKHQRNILKRNLI